MRLIPLIITDFGLNAKRQLLACAWATVCGLLVGCQAAPIPNLVQVIVPAPQQPVGIARLPFILYDGEQVVKDARAVQVQVVGMKGGSAAVQAGWQGTAVGYADAPTPYWVIYPELPSGGLWGLRATVTLADGRVTTADLVVEATDTPEGIAIGQPAVATRQRVYADQPDLSQLTSDPQPDPALYQTTIAEAIQNGKPTLLTFATPAFCKTRFCAPVIDVVKQVLRQYAGTVNFIHIEVWDDFNAQRLNPALAEWGLHTEPWTYIIDGQGRIVAALAGPISLQEVQTWLDSTLPQQP